MSTAYTSPIRVAAIGVRITHTAVFRSTSISVESVKIVL